MKIFKFFVYFTGKGLGKDENGISEPLKAKLKHSLTGVGYDPAEEFTEYWWTTLYDKAASNLEVGIFIFTSHSNIAFVSLFNYVKIFLSHNGDV